MGDADFNQFLRLKNQLLIEAEHIGREEDLSPVLLPTMSKDMDEQLKVAHKVVDVVDRANRTISVTLLRCSMDKPENSCAQVRLIAMKKENEKFQQFFCVNF